MLFRGWGKGSYRLDQRQWDQVTAHRCKRAVESKFSNLDSYLVVWMYVCELLRRESCEEKKSERQTSSCLTSSIQTLPLSLSRPARREGGADALLGESGRGLDVNQVSSRGSALLEAIRLNAPILIEKLIAAPGIDVNLADSRGTTPLMAAVEMDNPLLIYKLVSGRVSKALRGLLIVCRCADGRATTAILLQKQLTKETNMYLYLKEPFVCMRIQGCCSLLLSSSSSSLEQWVQT